jgi:hypothetical protein
MSDSRVAMTCDRLLLALAGLGAVGVVACSTAPSIPDMRADQRCHVWAQGGLGHAGVQVIQERARIYGTFGMVDGAFFSAPTEIGFPGPFGQQDLATYHEGERSLMIHGALGDLGPTIIGQGKAVVPGALGSLVVEFNEHCTDRDAALGVVSLVVVASQHH